MAETDTNEIKQEGTPTGNIGTGSEPKATDVVDRAVAAAERLEKANTRTEELVKRQEAIAARVMLGGRTDAGAIQKTPEQITDEKIDADVAMTMKRYGIRKPKFI